MMHIDPADSFRNIELRHLRYFLALAKELHYRKAADRLFISQSGLSKQIKQLEEILGVQLFERDKKQVSLTNSGRFFYEQVGNFQGYLNNIFDQLVEVEAGYDGKVSIGFVGSAMSNIVPELLLLARERFPKVIFSLDQVSNQLQIEKLMTSEIDLAFLRIRNLPEQLESVPVFTDTYSLVLPADHPVNKIEELSGQELKQENFILFEPTYSPDYHYDVVNICRQLGFEPKSTHNSAHPYTIFRLVENKMGISIVPSTLVKGFDLDIKFIEFADLPQRAVMYAAWNRLNTNPSLIKILDMIKALKITN